MTERRSLDPDPFGIAVSIATIVGGFAAVVSLYRDLSVKSVGRAHSRAVRALESVREAIAQIDRDLTVIRELSSAAIDLAPMHFGPGQRLLMPPIHFSEYSKAAERALTRLRQVLKATHRLERAVPTLPYVQPTATRDVMSLQLRVERLLRDRDRSLSEGLAEVGDIVAQARRMTDDLLAELLGHG